MKTSLYPPPTAYSADEASVPHHASVDYFSQTLNQLRDLIAEGQTAQTTRDSHPSCVDNRPDCGQLLERLLESSTSICQRLERAEAHNYELGLQLTARLNESQTDGLTGLTNRRTFDREFTEKYNTSQQSQSPLTLVILDIDHFKSVNDRFGHHVGDAVLVSVSRILRSSLPIEALLARYGGEEFALLLACTSIDDAIGIVEEMRQQVRDTRFCLNGQPLAVTMSCGIAALADSEHCEHLIERADEAMYAAKQAGRNRTFWHARPQLHPVTSEVEYGAGGAQRAASNPARTIDLEAIKSTVVTAQQERQLPITAASSLRTTRASWCDAAMLFWSIRQRLAEWKRGGEPFGLLAIEIDDGPRIARSFGSMALHFMMRAQLLHLDATLRDMDIVARTGQSRIVVLLPRTDWPELTPLLERLYSTMDRFAFPTTGELVEYSISLGVAVIDRDDDPQRLVQRAEKALSCAQQHGRGRFFAQDAQHTWEIELAGCAAVP